MVENIKFVMLFSLGLILVLTIRTFLMDRNEILAETKRAECIIEFEKIFPDKYNYAACADIKDYHLKSRDLD